MEKPPLQTSNAANIPFETFGQKRTHHESIFLRPFFYIGSMEKQSQNLWVYEKDQMVYRSISYVPGLYNIFDKILVAAADYKQRDPSMDSLKVTIDPGTNTISVYNNGCAVPVEFYREENVYRPELSYGNLYYSDELWPSFGSRLTNIFSTEFIIEIADGNLLKKYKQKFTNNMLKIFDPEITDCKANENWTKVTFKPDLEKFKMSVLEEDVVVLMKKRVLDMAWCLGNTVKVELDGQLVGIINSFEDYVALHMESAEKSRPVKEIQLLASREKKAEDRKTCIRDFEPGSYRDHADMLRNYKKFFNKELVSFSRADLQRSIPSMVDGLTSVQRKILFSSFEKKLCEEINVGQFISYVSEHFAYHHDEQSLASTIIGMAQNFVGSNNINLLKPNGHFGTRDMGGKDHAIARRIYTELNPVTRCLFHENDDKLVNFEDGRSIETNWYIPIIPFVLVNGSEVIREGWSTYIPSYKPEEIIANVRRLLNGENMVPMIPWYKGFTGTIEKSKNKGEYTVKGTFTIPEEIDASTFRITELPIRKWTEDYKQFLVSIAEGEPNVKDPLIEDFWNFGDHVTVDIKVKMMQDKQALIMQEGIDEKFKLTTTISTSNMHLFDAEGKIKKFDTPEKILEEFVPLRLEYYEKRKRYMLLNLERLTLILENQERFILGVVNGEIIVRNCKKTDLLKVLKQKGFSSIKPQVAGENDDNSEAREEGYEYLLSLPIRTLTLKGVQKLRAEKAKKKKELEYLKKTLAKSLWMTDLDVLEKKLNEIDSKEAEEKRKRSMEVGILKATPTNSLWKGKSIEPQVAGANDDSSEVQEDGYEYLLSFPIRTLTFEGFLKLKADKAEKKKEFDILEATSTEKLWMTDLVELQKKLDEIDSREEEEKRERSSQAENVVEVTKPKGRAGSKKNQKDSADDYILSLQKFLDAYNFKPSGEKTGALETEEPPLPADDEFFPFQELLDAYNFKPSGENTGALETEESPQNNRKGGATKKTSVVLGTDSENEVNDVDDDDDLKVVQQQPAPEAYNFKPSGENTEALETEEAPQNNRKGGAKKKTSVVLGTDSENEVNDVDDDDDFQVVQQPAPEAGRKKGGRKPAVAQNAKKAPAAEAPAASKKRNVGTKRKMGQKLITKFLQQKKVRKMRVSPFNKKSGANKDESPSEDLSSGSGSANNSPLNFEEEVVEIAPPAAKARPQRADRTQPKYIVHESESE